MPTRFRNHIAIALTLSLLLAGCGGGGESGSGTTVSSVYNNISTTTGMDLKWNPPSSYTDRTELDPGTDLSGYLIYVNDTGSFSNSEEPAAELSAVDPSTGSLVTSFDLQNLEPTLSRNVTYYVSMQSISSTGVRSDFSPAIAFTL